MSLIESVEILRASPAAIEIEANAVGQLADAANIADGHIKTANVRVAAYAGKRIGDAGAPIHDSGSRRSNYCAERRVLRRRRPPVGAAPKVWFMRTFRSSLSLVADVTK